MAHPWSSRPLSNGKYFNASCVISPLLAAPLNIHHSCISFLSRSLYTPQMDFHPHHHPHQSSLSYHPCCHPVILVILLSLSSCHPCHPVILVILLSSLSVILVIHHPCCLIILICPDLLSLSQPNLLFSS